MAKRKSNKSAKVREHLTANPEATGPEVAKALKVSPALVYGVKRRMNGAGKKKRAGGRRRSKAASPAGSQELLIQAAKLIKACGGVEEAQAALKMAGTIASTLA